MMGSAGGDLQGVQRKADGDPTRDRVQAILTLAEAATAGPWNPAIAPAETSAETPAEYLANALCGAGPLWVTWCANDTDDGFDHLIPVVTGDGPTSEVNARFIAAARTETPWLAVRLLEALDTIDTIDKARELHAKHEVVMPWIAAGTGEPRRFECCEQCQTSWPCPTWQALNGGNE